MLETIVNQGTFSVTDNFIFELSQANQSIIEQERTNLDRIVFDYGNKLSELDFSISTNRAFIFLLLDLCEQLQIPDGFQILLTIAENNNIDIGSRIKAASLFFTGISEANQYIERFKNVCEYLESAIHEEEDTNIKPLATFANYYLRVLSLHPQWILKLKDEIEKSKSSYSFLSVPFITEISNIPTINKTECRNIVIFLKDILLNRIPLLKKDKVEKAVLIESDTPYSEQLQDLPNPTFQSIRQVSVQKNTLEFKLANRGVTPLETEKELFKYMVSFGNMHYAKLVSALNILCKNNLSKNIEIIDWGCGQALATMTLGEYFKNNKINISHSKIILIEPSELTIKRAALHTSLFFPNSSINTVCKYIDDLVPEDIQTSQDSIKIHLFSNILDVELFSLYDLEELISTTQKGLNYFVCVSPYINDIKAERLDAFKRYFETKYDSFELLLDIQNSGKSNDDFWCCNNAYNNYSISHGCYSNCKNYTENGCDNKWTRVIKVFRVEI